MLSVDEELSAIYTKAVLCAQRGEVTSSMAHYLEVYNAALARRKDLERTCIRISSLPSYALHGYKSLFLDEYIMDRKKVDEEQLAFLRSMDSVDKPLCVLDRVRQYLFFQVHGLLFKNSVVFCWRNLRTLLDLAKSRSQCLAKSSRYNIYFVLFCVVIFDK
jgi:hypothetical protein